MGSGSDQERDRLIRQHEAAAQSFDRAVMTLAAGSLGISLAFVHDIAPSPRCVSLLATAWALLAASLLAVLVSFLTSQAALRAYTAMYDDRQEITRPRSSKWTQALNMIAAGLLISGIVALVWFAILNLRVEP